MSKIILEDVNCNLCKSSNSNKIFEKEGMNIVKCSKCGLVYVNPRLSQMSLEELYSKDYYTGEGFDSSVNYDDVHSRGSKTDLETEIDYNYRMDMITRYKHNGRLLDIGCAFGDFLDYAKENFDIYGVEISSYAAKKAIERFGNKIYNGTIENANLKSNYFDVVTMIEVIEHLPDPLRTIKEVNRLMKKGGIIVIQTGNINSIIPRIKGGDWGYIRPQGHLYYFSRKTLEQLLKESGFTVISYSSTGKAPSKVSEMFKLQQKHLISYLSVIRKMCNIASKIGITGSIIIGEKKEELN